MRQFYDNRVSATRNNADNMNIASIHANTFPIELELFSFCSLAFLEIAFRSSKIRLTAYSAHYYSAAEKRHSYRHLWNQWKLNCLVVHRRFQCGLTIFTRWKFYTPLAELESFRASPPGESNDGVEMDEGVGEAAQSIWRQFFGEKSNFLALV